jgi:aarF domain-containing kinase
MFVKSCRIQYAKLWRALILADVDGIKSAAVAMNAGESYQLFAGMLTNRPWDKVRHSRSLRTTVMLLKRSTKCNGGSS